MREFFVEEEQLYLPPNRDLTAKFCRQILSGEKELIEIYQIKQSINVPQDSQIKTSVLWEKVKNDPLIKKHMPDYTKKQTPAR